jgi:hypothetical protein
MVIRMTEDRPNEKPITDLDISQTEGEDNEDLQTYAANIIRPERGGFQDLIASELSEAIHSVDKISKVLHVLEAFYLLNDEQQVELIPKLEDREELSRIYDMALSIAYMPPLPTGSFSDNDRFMSIPFNFAASKAIYYFKDWLFTRMLYQVGPREHWEEISQKLQTEPFSVESRIWRSYCEEVYYMLMVPTLIQNCLQVKTMFLAYAMPKVTKLSRAIFEAYVTPACWQGLAGSKTKGDKKQ